MKYRFGFEWIGIIITTIALIFGLFQWVYTSVPNFGDTVQVLANDVMYTYERMYFSIAVLLCLTVGVLIISAFFNGKLLARASENFRELEQLSQLKNATVMVNSIADETKDFTDYMLRSEGFMRLQHKKSKLSQKDKDLIRTNIQSVKRKFGEYSMDVLNNTKNLFDIITNNEVAVTIKYFNYNQRKNVVTAKTGGRDSVSKNRRKLTDVDLSTFPAETNTAFNEVIQFNKIYTCEDLVSEYDKGKYQNANPNWRKFYNACLVVGFHYEKSSSIETMSTTGALCIDGKKGNFDNVVAENFAKTIANSYAGAYKQYLIYTKLYGE